MGVLPDSPNPDPFQTKKCHFPHWFSDQISEIHTHFQIWSNLASSRLSDSGGSVSFRFIFCVRTFSIQRTQLSRSLEQVRPDQAEIMSSLSD